MPVYISKMWTKGFKMLEIEERRVIIGFPNYEVTSFGRVFNIQTGREMVLSPNEEGILTVGLFYGDRQYRRSVKVLVARAFVLGETEIFNTPIQLDGDRYNMRADNIVWRPRWFAHRYFSQFRPPLPDWYYMGPILEEINKIEYENILHAATTNGLLCKDIRESMLYRNQIFPTREVYTMLR